MIDERQPRLFKGHGTGNDFVLLIDGEGQCDPSPQLVAALCDRRTGIGGDGLLRVVPTALCPEVANQAGEAIWFMDYRNGDGSLAEMCGNGIRVFGRFLVDEGLAQPGMIAVATRGGVHVLDVPREGDIRVGMGAVAVPKLRETPMVSVPEGGRWPAAVLFAPNPHAVVIVDDVAQAGSLHSPPLIEPGDVFPDGANVEFVQQLAPGHIRMRVHERGVGETRSCGTGAIAAAWVAGAREGGDVVVEVPGGTLTVASRADGGLDLIGPAVLVGEVLLHPHWWTAAPR